MRDNQRSMQVTDEASAEGLRLAREAGEAYQKMVHYFIEEIAHCGRVQDSGDFRVGVAVESAEPLWYPSGGQLVLGEPPVTANQHLEVVVTDAMDGRFVPQLAVAVTVLRQGREIGTWDLPFLWHPTMYHYGRNVTITGSGPHTLRVSIAAPTFHRHDKVNGRRYGEPVVVEFADIDLKTGREP